MNCFQLHNVPRFRTDWRELTHSPLIASGRSGVLILQERPDCLPEVHELQHLISGELAALEIGLWNNIPCLTLQLPAETLFPEQWHWSSLRRLLAVGDPALVEALCRGVGLIHWYGINRFCGVCGGALKVGLEDVGLNCHSCNAKIYPQIAPAVIVAILRGKEILLAHNCRFPAGRHGLIAGFVEMGESLEGAVRREVREETSLEVKNIRYLSSQSWPFPNALMVGFTAEYAGGEAQADGAELDHLGWFTPQTLPDVPPEGSIARKIIDQYCRGELFLSRDC